MTKITDIRWEWPLLGLISGVVGTYFTSLFLAASEVYWIAYLHRWLRNGDPVLVMVMVLGISFAIAWAGYELATKRFDFWTLLALIVWTPLAYWMTALVFSWVVVSTGLFDVPNPERVYFVLLFSLCSFLGSSLMLLAARVAYRRVIETSRLLASAFVMTLLGGLIGYFITDLPEPYDLYFLHGIWHMAMMVALLSCRSAFFLGGK